MSKMESPITMPCQSETSMYDAKHGHPMPKSSLGRFLVCVRELFHFIVWKPCPPYLPVLLDKFLFAPKRPTYYFEPKPNRANVYDISFRPGCEPLVTEEKVIPTWLKKLDCYYINAEHTTRIACRYIKSCICSTPDYVIFFCHANSVDIGFDINLHYYMGWRLRSDIFVFDYSGYGQSSGEASESNLYKDTMAAYQFLTTQLKVNPNKIILFGQSLGTAAVIDLTSKGVEARGLILDGLFISGLRIMFPDMQTDYTFDKFNNMEKIPLITCPTLVIHGSMDPITHFQHAERFFELSKSLVPPLIIPSGHHLDLMNYRAYWNRLEIFLCKELSNLRMRFANHCNPFCTDDHRKKPNNNPLHTRLVWPFDKSDSVQNTVYKSKKE